MRTHTCAADGCQHLVPTFNLMCTEHWKLVPTAVRLAMARQRAADKRHGGRPSPAQASLCAQAVEAVRDKQICRAERVAAGTPGLF